MPQMAPYNWHIMFLIFNFIMMTLVAYSYFFKNNSPTNKIKKGEKIYFLYKW